MDRHGWCRADDWRWRLKFGVEVEGSLLVTDAFTVRSSLGYIDADVDDPEAVAALTPELTFSLSPEYNLPMAGGGEMTFGADYSFHDDMFGEPTAGPRPLYENRQP